MVSHERLYDTAELARYLRVSASSLSKWRLTGNGPKFIKIGHKVAYRQSDIDAYLARQTRGSTAAEVA